MVMLKYFIFALNIKKTEILNYADIIILLFLAYGAYKGFAAGIVGGITSLVGLILGIWCAMVYPYLLESQLLKLRISEKYVHIIAIVLTFLVVMVVISLIGKILTKLLKAVALDTLNRMLGLAFGLLKYAVVVCLIIVLVDSIDKSYDFISSEFKSKSIFYYPLLDFSKMAYNFFSNK